MNSDTSHIDVFLCRLEEPDLDLFVLKFDCNQWAFDCDIGQLMSNNLDSSHVCPVLQMDTIVAFCEKCFDASVIQMFFQICELNLPDFRAYNLSDDFKPRKGNEVIQTSAGCLTPNAKLPRQLLDGIPSNTNSFSEIIDTIRSHFHNFPLDTIGDKDADNSTSAGDTSNSSCDASLDENTNPYNKNYNNSDNKFSPDKGASLDCSTSMESCESIYVDVDIDPDNSSLSTFGNDLGYDNARPRRAPTPEPYPDRGSGVRLKDDKDDHVHHSPRSQKSHFVNRKAESQQNTTTNNNNNNSNNSSSSNQNGLKNEVYDMRVKGINARENMLQVSDNIISTDIVLDRQSLYSGKDKGSKDKKASSFQHSPSLAKRKEHYHNINNNNNNNIKNYINKNNNKASPLSRSHSPGLYNGANNSISNVRPISPSPNWKRYNSPLSIKYDMVQTPLLAATNSVDDPELQQKLSAEKEFKVQEARRRAAERIRTNKRLAEERILKEKQESASKLEEKRALRDQKIFSFVERQQKSVMISPSDIISPKQATIAKGSSSDSPQTIATEPWNVFTVRTDNYDVSNYNNKNNINNNNSVASSSFMEMQSTPEVQVKRTSITPIKKFTPKELQAVGLTPEDLIVQDQKPARDPIIVAKSASSRSSMGALDGPSRADAVLQDARDFKSLLDDSLNESFDVSVDHHNDYSNASARTSNPAVALFRSPTGSVHSKTSGARSAEVSRSSGPPLSTSVVMARPRPRDSIDMITVTVQRAWGLRDTLTGTNPYIVVDWGALGRAATQAITSSTTPTFSSFLKFKSPFKPTESVRKTASSTISFNGKMYCMPKADDMRISVYSRNKIVSDELVGEAVVEASKLLGYFIAACPEDGNWLESTNIVLTVSLSGLDGSAAGSVELVVALDSDHSAFT